MDGPLLSRSCVFRLGSLVDVPHLPDAHPPPIFWRQLYLPGLVCRAAALGLGRGTGTQIFRDAFRHSGGATLGPPLLPVSRFSWHLSKVTCPKILRNPQDNPAERIFAAWQSRIAFCTRADGLKLATVAGRFTRCCYIINEGIRLNEVTGRPPIVQ